MRLTPVSVFILVIVFSCENNDLTQHADLPVGTYKGYFIRSRPEIKYAPSNVTITFTTNRFRGESSTPKYPAICNGSYKITGDEIDFTNDCPWTAEFDWSYILSGKFHLSVEGETVVMTKSLNDQTDTYLLTLQ